MIEKPIPTTFEELQARREELERSIRINKFNMERSFGDAGSELPKFLLKKVAAPAAVAGLAIFGISKFTGNNNDAKEVGRTETDGHTEIKYQKVEQQNSPSFITKLWLFAAPFIQPMIKDFLTNKFSGMTSNDEAYPNQDNEGNIN